MKYPILAILIILIIVALGFVYRWNIMNTFTKNIEPETYFSGLELEAVVALENNDDEGFQEALKKGADINKRGEQGVVPYLYFIKENNSQALIKLYKSGSDFHYELPRSLGKNFPENFGWVPAASANILKDLLDAGLDPNFRPNSWTLLFYTLNTSSGVNWLSLELLLSRGADINAQTGLGKTPLHYAVDYEDFDLAKYLVDRGADPRLKNKKGNSVIDILRIRKERYKEGIMVSEIDDFLGYLKNKGYEI